MLLESLKLENLRRRLKSIISKYEKDQGLNSTPMTYKSKLQKFKLLDR
jgi:AmiR/NasT family two-component response regulator